MPVPGVKVGFWKITESPEQLLQMYSSGEDEMHLAQMIPERKTHSLSSRLLARHFFPGAEFIKDQHGKPHLKGIDQHISWSHSGNYAAFIASDVHISGIDIETISPRIRKIEDKFCNDQDKSCIHKTKHTESLLLIWAAKECMYKSYGKKEVDFKKHMYTEAFDIHHEGRFFTRFHKDDIQKQYLMEYMFFDGHVAVWTLGITESSHA